MGTGLDARQKGDIYWKKLKRYFAAVEARDENPEEKDNALMLAKEVFARAKEIDDEAALKCDRLVTGDEFKPMPPTATGDEVFADAVLLVAVNLRRITLLLKASHTDSVLLKHLNSLAETMNRALTSYYNSSGIDEIKGVVISPLRREEAKQEHEQIIKSYCSEVKNFRVNVSNEIVKNIIKEINAKAESNPPEDARLSASSEITDSVFDIYRSINPEVYDANRNQIDKVRKEYNTYLAREAGLKDMLPLIKKAAEGKTAEHTRDMWISPTEAYEEYKSYLDERLRALAYARRCCLIYVRCILTGETVDPLVANYIKSHWGATVDTLPQDVPVVTFERFVRVKLLPEDKTEIDLSSIDAIRQTAGELADYRNNHPEQFEDQTFSSLFFGIEELPIVERKARILRDFVASVARGRISMEVSPGEREELYNIWIDADACARVASMVLGYAAESESKSIKALLPTFARDVHDISFLKQWEISARCLGKVTRRSA